MHGWRRARAESNERLLDPRDTVRRHHGARECDGLGCFEIVTVVRYVIRVKNEWVAENVDGIGFKAKEIDAWIESPYAFGRLQIHMRNRDPHVAVPQHRVPGTYTWNFLA